MTSIMPLSMAREYGRRPLGKVMAETRWASFDAPRGPCEREVQPHAGGVLSPHHEGRSQSVCAVGVQGRPRQLCE